MKSERSVPQIKRPVVWVTGASRGIGREVAKEFASIGCIVCLSGRSRQQLKSAVSQIIEKGGRAYAIPLDIKDLKSLANAHRTIVKSVGEVNVLVNNAGVTAFRSFVHTTPKEFENILQTNLLGHVYCAKAVVPGMIKAKGGYIINVISHAAMKTFTNSSAYAASKSGVFGWAKVVREELGAYNIKVVNVLPGATDTRMWSKKVRAKYSHRMMKPASIAETIVSIYQLPDDVVVDEIVLRPILGDLS